MSRIALEDVYRAAEILSGRIQATPSIISSRLSELFDREIAVKLETLQVSGCFKTRGIINKLLSLSEEERARGLVTVSGGNHGIAMAKVARLMNLTATIVMPQTAPLRSQEQIRADGGELIITTDASAAFEAAEAMRDQGLVYVHPFDDPLIIAGHGTLGLEFITTIPELTDVIVSIGGGGLISGVATAIKGIKPDVRIWGVETQGADAMSRALAAGHPVKINVTSICSTLGAPSASELTLEHVRALVEDIFIVSDAEAVEGVRLLAEEAKLWVEPAAGCLIAAIRTVKERIEPNAIIGLVLCGGNASVNDVANWTKQFATTGMGEREGPALPGLPPSRITDSVR